MALSVEMMIFHKHLDVVRSAFLVAVSPGIRCGRPQRSGCWSKCRYSSCCPVTTSVTECADSILSKAVDTSWYALSSCVTCGGMWAHGLQRCLYGAALVTSGWLVMLVTLVA
jgi:hypothetical protein